MYKTLIPNAIGLKPADLDDAIRLAKLGGFTGLEVSAPAIAELIGRTPDGAAAVRKRFDDAGITPASFGLPVEWRKDEDTYRADLAKLPHLASAAMKIGVTRCATWVLPGSHELPWDAHWAQFLRRFKPIAEILGEHGISLGLEFIGPKTLRDTFKYPFVHTLWSMIALAHDVAPNVGLLLDCFHWHTAHNSVSCLRALKPAQVVYVHVNDARAGVDTDAQEDGKRDLPGATGVIDIAGFLGALRAIGYDGPVAPEPFQRLPDLPSDEARVTKVGAAMDDIWKKGGLG